ncbi:cation:proton antiporter [Bradyrhizobium oligotrophicum]|uniref:cation:proton antiporter n=1 Tax=Bradyrhizobium oligotrophicum TaxID=44255 RepID=UPI003EB7159A
MVFSLLDLSAILLALSALFGWLNQKYSPLPHSIGLLLMSVVVSGILVAIDVAAPSHHLFAPLTNALLQIDFTSVVMNGMLGFLLFAGSLHVDLQRLKRRAIPVLTLALFGTGISTLVVGFGFYAACTAIGLPMSLAWRLVFGALISPTDPVAVMSTLKNINVPPDLEIEMQGESLFNDGVGIVLFTILLRYATGSGDVGAVDIGEMLLLEAGGGILLGLAGGYIAYRAMHAIDDYAIEVLVSLALVTSVYAAALRLHCSAPLAVVAAGLLIGDRGPRYAMSEQIQRYLFGLWTLIDEILNSVLFLLIGLEVLLLRFGALALLGAATAIPLVLVGRLTAVSLPLLFLARTKLVSAHNIPFLTWAGVRGGISVALALSLPEDPAKAPILAATYAVVVFSVIVQGSTLGLVARRTLSLPAKAGR